MKLARSVVYLDEEFRPRPQARRRPLLYWLMRLRRWLRREGRYL
jgi:hypothetical protein